MYGKIKDYLQKELADIREAGLYKEERIINSPQEAEIKLNSGAEVLNFCANNYLGLSNHPRLVEAAKEALDDRGFGMSSVRLFAEHRIFIRPSKPRLPSFSVRKTPFCMPLVSMPMVVCLNRCLAPKMPSFPIRSTTLLSSTACAFPKHSVFATKMPTWPIWKRNSKKLQKQHGSKLSLPTAYSRWTAT